MTLRLEHILDYGVGKNSIQIEMAYMPEISKNASKTRDGFIKSKVRNWMNDLAWGIRMMTEANKIVWASPVLVKIDCVLNTSQTRMPDTQNFVDIISDAIEEGLGINDVNFEFLTSKARREDTDMPRIIITCSKGE